MSEAKSMTIGCDLGDRFSRLCIVDDTGQIVEQLRVRTTPESIQRVFESRPTSRVVLEVGGHSRWVAELVERLGHQAVVANPRQVPMIYQSRSKTDRNDAELLARLGRVDEKLLAPIQHRSEETQIDLAMVRARDVLVRERTRLINHARGIVKSFGARFRPCSASSFHARAATDLPPALGAALGPIIECIANLTQQIKEYEQRLEDRARQAYPATVALEQVPGVGLLTALTYVLTLENPARFKKSRDVGGFLGLVPRKDQSGDSDPQRRITKAGDAYLRRLLVNCSQYILGPFGPDTDLRRWGIELAKRGGRNAKKRAVVAVARRLAVLLHRLWVSGEVYQPVGYAEHKMAA